MILCVRGGHRIRSQLAQKYFGQESKWNLIRRRLDIFRPTSQFLRTPLIRRQKNHTCRMVRLPIGGSILTLQFVEHINPAESIWT